MLMPISRQQVMLHHTQHHSRIHLCTLLHHTQHQQQLIKHHLHIPHTRLIQQHIHQHLILLLKQRLTLQFIHRLQHILPCCIHHIQRILTRLMHPQHRTTLILQVHIQEHILRDLTEATFLHAWVKNVHISLWKKRKELCIQIFTEQFRLGISMFVNHRKIQGLDDLFGDCSC